MTSLFFSPSSLPGPREVFLRAVQHPGAAPGAEREADQADRVQGAQGGMAGPLHQQGVHEEEALLEAGHKVRHPLPGAPSGAGQGFPTDPPMCVCVCD